jgi:hypothetical protein
MPPNLLERATPSDRQLSSLPPKFDDYRPPLLSQEQTHASHLSHQSGFAPPKLHEYLPPLFGSRTASHVAAEANQSQFVGSGLSNQYESPAVTSYRPSHVISQYPVTNHGLLESSFYNEAHQQNHQLLSGEEFKSAEGYAVSQGSRQWTTSAPYVSSRSQSQANSDSGDMTHNGHYYYKTDSDSTESEEYRTLFHEDFNHPRTYRNAVQPTTVPCVGASKFFLEECVVAKSIKWSGAMAVP